MARTANTPTPAFPAPSAVLELLKPVTWFPPMWAFGCGVVSSGVPLAHHWAVAIIGVLLAGPLICATSQAVNDWFDRHVDAINEPNRPIPSGRIPGRWGLYVAIAWTVLSLMVAATLGRFVLAAAVAGLVLAWAYSAPPVRLKQNGWWGNAACGFCYEGLAWFTGAAAMAGGTLPDTRVIAIAVLYSIGAHGIMTLNDFKSIEGDRRMGIGSLPVRLGARNAGRVACAVMAAPQLVVAALLFQWAAPMHAIAVLAVLALQGLCMARLLRDPRGLAPWYNATGVSLYVLGMLASAFALGSLGGGARVNAPSLGWLGIVRLGLVQAALGAIVVLTTSTLNRIMVVELALPAMLPGALVAVHYALQFLRPRLGHGSDVGGRRTPWIVGGMVVLAGGGLVASIATAWMATDLASGVALAFAGFVLIGVGVGAAGTSLLVLLAKRVDDRRRAPAATIVWIMMIAGFAVTAGLAGHLLDPYTPARLVEVTAGVCAVAIAVTLLALWGVEGQGSGPAAREGGEATPKVPFREALAQVWDETQSRRFTVFIFVSMLAYGAQDLILEPFAGAVFGLTPGQSTKLSGAQHGGVLVGMLLIAFAGGVGRGGRPGLLRIWTIVGCGASALALFGLAVAGYVGQAWPLTASVVFLGVANGAYAIAAIGSMMALVVAGRKSREGVRMGLWGAAQALAFGSGGFLGTVAVDLARGVTSSPVLAYATVFASEGLLFLVAAWLAARVDPAGHESAAQPESVTEGGGAPAFALQTRGA